MVAPGWLVAPLCQAPYSRHPAPRWPVATCTEPSHWLPWQGSLGGTAMLEAVAWCAAEGDKSVLRAAVIEGPKTPEGQASLCCSPAAHSACPAVPPRPVAPPLAQQLRAGDAGRELRSGSSLPPSARLAGALLPLVRRRVHQPGLCLVDTRTHTILGMSLSVPHVALTPAEGTAARAGGIQPTLLPAAPSAVLCVQGLCVCRWGFGSC